MSTRFGYIEIDHRASPGTPRAPEGTHFEADAYKCPHCQRIVVMSPTRARERAFCMKCDHHLCDLCGAAKECTPALAKFDLLARKP